MSLLIALGRNREGTLRDGAAALEAYREVADSAKNTGGADYFYGLQGAARILANQKKFDDALSILDRVDPEKVGGSWRGSMRLSRAGVLDAAGRGEEAKKVYRLVVEDGQANAAHRKRAEEAIR